MQQLPNSLKTGLIPAYIFLIALAMSYASSANADTTTILSSDCVKTFSCDVTK